MKLKIYILVEFRLTMNSYDKHNLIIHHGLALEEGTLQTLQIELQPLPLILWG